MSHVRLSRKARACLPTTHTSVTIGAFPITRFLTALVLSVPLALLAGCGHPKLQSACRDREIRIDGDASEWEGALYSFDESRVLVGALNDGSNLYLCLGTEDQHLKRQLLGSGMTLWLDPTGGDRRTFGLHFPGARRERPPGEGEGSPAQMAATAAPSPSGNGNEPPDTTGGTRDTTRATGDPARWRARPGGAGPEGAVRDREMVRADLAPPDSTVTVQVLRPASLQTIGAPPVADGLDYRIGLKDDALVYEIRIPLEGDAQHPYAIGASAGRTIGIGIEAPAPPANRSFRRSERGTDEGGTPGDNPEGGRRGGRHGGWGGGGRGARGMGGHRPMQAAGPLKIWATVHLAQAPAAERPPAG